MKVHPNHQKPVCNPSVHWESAAKFKCDPTCLVEDGSVGAEEGVLGEAALGVRSADVEHLALSLLISVVT